MPGYACLAYCFLEHLHSSADVQVHGGTNFFTHSEAHRPSQEGRAGRIDIRASIRIGGRVDDPVLLIY